jgi:hypothetical protein
MWECGPKEYKVTALVLWLVLLCLGVVLVLLCLGVVLVLLCLGVSHRGPIALLLVVGILVDLV